jgi:hypothetical protein
VSWSYGYVYLIKPQGHNVYKVGSSVNPDRRLKDIQRKTAGLMLEVIAKKQYYNHTVAEIGWHIEFKDSRLPGGGEWFALSQHQVNLFIEAAKVEVAP